MWTYCATSLAVVAIATCEATHSAERHAQRARRRYVRCWRWQGCPVSCGRGVTFLVNLALIARPPAHSVGGG
jgi:hypothetical protein